MVGYLPAKGLEQLLGTINKVKRQINPKLRIEGILLTMVSKFSAFSSDMPSQPFTVPYFL